MKIAYADPPYLGCCGIYGHLSALKPQIAEALASVRLGRPGEKAPRERSSLRDIGGMAHRMAESLRASKEKEDAT